MSDKENKSGVELIAEERKRQIEQKGYNEQHDLEESVGSLAMLGVAYAYSGIGDRMAAIKACPISLPFFKPKTAERDLVRAGAMIAAAIDRLHIGEQKDE